MESLSNLNRKFVFGSFEYCYDLIKQERKTLSLTVTPNLQIFLKSPNQADNNRIDKFLKKKWFWLEKQLAYFRKFQRKQYKKEYVSGESLFYLGKQYRLQVKRGKNEKVSLLRGCLLVITKNSVSDGVHTKKLVTKWFDEKTNKIFNERFEAVKTLFAYDEMPKLVVRDMKRRWGSYKDNHIIGLNPKLIRVPKECIDYVIAHEMCHVKHRDHGKEFYRLLEKKYPKWEKIKDKLEEFGVK
jgi:predicted metal-dependent hydrolase